MALKNRLRGHILDTYLKHERRLRRGRASGSRLDVFIQVDDAHSFLLLQRLVPLVEHHQIPTRLWIVPEPGLEANPAPKQRRQWTLDDAHLLAHCYPLDAPGRRDLPGEEIITQAQRILLKKRPASQHLNHARQVLRLVWSNDLPQLRKLARTLGQVSSRACRRKLAQHTARLHRWGHYQGSMVRHKNEWFWGIDRFNMLERSLSLTPTSLPFRDTIEAPAGMVDETGRITLEFYFSFRSPYSYLAVEPTLALASRPEVDLQIRPVLPMVMRGLAVPPAKRWYIVRDCKRLALEQGTPFGNICDPVGTGAEQCLATFVVADAHGRGGDFVREASRGIWSEAVDVASKRGLRRVAERAGVPWKAVKKSLADPEPWQSLATNNRQALFDAGLWGVPSYRVGDLATWGQDRLPLLERLIDQALNDQTQHQDK